MKPRYDLPAPWSASVMPWGRPAKFLQQWFDEPEKVQHLLKLAARVLVEPPVTREDVQLLEQLKRLAGSQQFLQGRILVA